MLGAKKQNINKLIRFKIIHKIWGRILSKNASRSRLLILKRLYLFIDGILLVFLIKCYHIFLAKKIYDKRMDLIFRKIFCIDNLFLFSFFFKFKFRFMYFFNFLINIDKFWFSFFNFLISYKSLSLVTYFLCRRIKYSYFGNKITDKKCNFLSGFFIPVNRFFSIIEIFKKIFSIDLINFDFFSYIENHLYDNKYVIPYDNFFFRLNVISFFVLYKYVLTSKVVKYNEYFRKSYLYNKYQNLGEYFCKRIWHIRSLAIGPHGPIGFGVGLDGIYLYFFIYEIKHKRFLIFKYDKLQLGLSIELNYSVIEVYKNNIYLQFKNIVLKNNIFNALFASLLPAFFENYLLLDLYFGFQRNNRSYIVRKKKIFYNYKHISGFIKKFENDKLYSYNFIKNKLYFMMSSYLIKDNSISNYYFGCDLIYGFFGRRFYFWNCLLNVIFLDYKNAFAKLWSNLSGKMLIKRVDNTDYKDIKEERDEVYFLELTNASFFWFFKINFIEYFKWFSQFEYFYWRVMHVDFSLKFSIRSYLSSSICDFVFCNRYLVSIFIAQKFYYFTYLRSRRKNFFFIYYMFLLYRDIFFKGIFSSFECNLLYFFFIFKNHNVNNDLLVYIFRVNTKILKNFIC